MLTVPSWKRFEAVEADLKLHFRLVENRAPPVAKVLVECGGHACDLQLGRCAFDLDRGEKGEQETYDVEEREKERRL